MRFVYNNDGKLIGTHQEGTDEELKLQYKGEKIYISNDYLGETAVIENDTARAKTEAEKVADGERVLQEGEYIKGKEIITIEKPDNFHVWDIKKKKWIYDKDLEINSLYEVTAGHEQSVQNLEKELKEAQENNRRALVRSLTTEIKILKEKITENYKKLDELEE